MSLTPRPTEPQLTPEALTADDHTVCEADEAPAADAAGGEGTAEARPFGNLTENLTTRWNVESR